MNPMLPTPDFSGPRPLLAIPPEWDIALNIVMGVLILASLYYAMRMVKKEGRLNPLYLLIGGGFGVFFEPAGDLMAHVTFHAEQINAVGSYGFHVPLWMVGAYIISTGVPIIWLLDMVRSGMTMKKWMMTFLLCIPAAIVFELPLIFMGAIEYYGPQPFSIFGYPVWMAFANTAGLFFVPTAIFYFLTEKGVIDKSNAFLLIPLTPMIVAGSHVAGAFPHGYGMNSGNPDLLMINVFSLLAIAGCTFLTWIAGTSVVRDRAKKSGP